MSQLRRRAFAGIAVVAMIGLIVLAGRFVRPAETAETARLDPAATPTVTPAPTPTATPPPAPDPTPAFQPAPTPTPALLVASDVIVEPRAEGVVIRPQGRTRDQVALARPTELLPLSCGSVLDGEVAFTARNTDRTAQHLVVLDTTTDVPRWRISQLPRLDQDGQVQRRPDFCTGLAIGDVWVFATIYNDSLHLAVSDDHGRSFIARRLVASDVADPIGDQQVSLRAWSDGIEIGFCPTPSGTSCPADAPEAVAQFERRAIEQIFGADQAPSENAEDDAVGDEGGD